MPSYIVKPDSSRDEYVYWSTVVEAPLFHGDRIAMHSYLTGSGEGPADERLDRADEFGTSCRDLGGGVRFFDWSDDEVIFEQRGTVNRDDLWALARRVARDEDVSDMIQPFEDAE